MSTDDQQKIPLAVDSDFKLEPVQAKFPESPTKDAKIIGFEPDSSQPTTNTRGGFGPEWVLSGFGERYSQNEQPSAVSEMQRAPTALKDTTTIPVQFLASSIFGIAVGAAWFYYRRRKQAAHSAATGAQGRILKAALPALAFLFVIHWASGWGLLISETQVPPSSRKTGWYEFDHKPGYTTCSYWIGFEIIERPIELGKLETDGLNCRRWRKVR